MEVFPKDRGENEKIFDLPPPTKQKHLNFPMFCFPCLAWDFGLKLTQLWKNPDASFLEVGERLGLESWKNVEHIIPIPSMYGLFTYMNG